MLIYSFNGEVIHLITSFNKNRQIFCFFPYITTVPNKHKEVLGTTYTYPNSGSIFSEVCPEPGKTGKREDGRRHTPVS